MALISVIVPVYNTALYLRRCLDSLAAQTFSDLEILIVDDGSTDKSAQIADEYATAFDNFRVIHKANAGLPQARKTGVEASTGSYIGFVDSDDWVEPSFFETLFSLLKKSGKADAIACCGFWLDDGRRKRIGSDFSKGVVTFSPEEAFTQIHWRKNVTTYAWNKLYSRSLFDGIDFPVSHVIGEDYCIVTQLVSKASIIIQTDQPLYRYFQLPNSMSRGGFSAIHSRSLANYQIYMRKNCEKYPQLVSSIENYYEVEELATLVAMCKNKDYNIPVAQKIEYHVRQRFSPFLTAKHIAPGYKVSAAAVSIDWRFFCFLMRFLIVVCSIKPINLRRSKG